MPDGDPICVSWVGGAALGPDGLGPDGLGPDGLDSVAVGLIPAVDWKVRENTLIWIRGDT